MVDHLKISEMGLSISPIEMVNLEHPLQAADGPQSRSLVPEGQRRVRLRVAYAQQPRSGRDLCGKMSLMEPTKDGES